MSARSCSADPGHAAHTRQARTSTWASTITPIEGRQVERLIGVIVDAQVDVRAWRVCAACPGSAEHDRADTVDPFHLLDNGLDEGLNVHELESERRQLRCNGWAPGMITSTAT